MKAVKLGDILTESKVESVNPDPDRRITVRLFLKGIEKRPYEAGVEGGTKYYTRKAGQFIFGKQNLFKGAFAIIPEELNGFDSSSDIPSFDVRKDCLPEWVYYYFKQGEFYKTFESIATGTGSRRIQPSRLFEVEIPLPEISEQKRIISNAIAIEKKFKATVYEFEYQTDLLKKLRQSILQDAVQGKLVKQNPKDEPASELLKRIKAEKEKLIAAGKLKKEKPLPPISESEIPFELPKGWEWCRLGEISIISRGSSPRPKGDSRYFSKVETEYNWITISDITKYCKDNILYQTNEYLTAEGSTMSRYAAKNEFIIAVSGSTTGKCCITGISGYFYDGLASVKFLDNTISNEYLLIYMLQYYQYINTSVEGLFPNINTDFLKTLLFCVPPFSEQQRIVLRVKELMQLCDKLEKEIETSKMQVEKLMQSVLREAFEPKEAKMRVESL